MSCFNTFSEALSEDLDVVTEDKINQFCQNNCPATIERISAKLVRDCAEAGVRLGLP